MSAEMLLASGNAGKAAQLYDEVREARIPQQRIVEATRGAILARGGDGVPLLVEQLNSNDPAMVGIGLMAASELSGIGVTKKLVAALADVAPGQRALLILALADRGDVDAIPAMLEASKRGPMAVRLAALEALRSLGDASCVPVLLNIAGKDDGKAAQAAKATLKTLPGEGVDADLIARLANAQGTERVALIELVGLRRINAVPSLLEAVNDNNADVRTAALVAMGEVIQLDNISILISRVLDPKYALDGPVALKALQAACIRMPDREACAEKLAATLATSPSDAKEAILETLTAMGGKKSLQTVQTAANSEDVLLQDIATRLLGSWMSVDAGPVLLELATAPDSSYRVRALRGYLRLVRQFVMPDEQRATMCRQAWAAAERDAERKLVLQVIERYPSDGMLPLAIKAAKHPTLGTEATKVAIFVAKKIGKQDEVEVLLEHAQQ